MNVVISNHPQFQPISTVSLQRSLRQVIRQLTLPDHSLNQPVVVLLASANAATLNSLIDDISTVFHSYFHDSTGTLNINKDEQRLDFEADVYAILRRTAIHRNPAVITVKDIHRLRGRAPLVLHSIADIDAPPFRRVVYLMTVIIDELEEATAVECNNAIIR